MDVRRAAPKRPDAKDPGDSSGEATPVPIPNTEVKLSSAEDTERAAFRENRSSPGFLRFRGPSPTRPSAVGPACRLSFSLMTVTVGSIERRPASAARPPNGAAAGPPSTRPAICPYLLPADGAWRSPRPHRDHRCARVAPAALVAAEKQRALCLTDAHATCATYEAARASPRRTRPASASAQPCGRSRVPTPVILEPDGARLHRRCRRLPGRGRSARPLLVVLMVVAFVAVVAGRVDRRRPAGVDGAAAAPSPSPVRLRARPTPRPRLRHAVEPSPSAAHRAPHPPSPRAAGTRRTRSSRATRSGIAATFGSRSTTVMAAQQHHRPASIKVGQILKHPAKAPGRRRSRPDRSRRRVSAGSPGSTT